VKQLSLSGADCGCGLLLFRQSKQRQLPINRKGLANLIPATCATSSLGCFCCFNIALIEYASARIKIFFIIYEFFLFFRTRRNQNLSELLVKYSLFPLEGLSLCSHSDHCTSVVIHICQCFHTLGFDYMFIPYMISTSMTLIGVHNLFNELSNFSC
jgi:hypothetical protein